MKDSRDYIRPKGWLESLNCAMEGVIYAFRTQRHIRYHYAIAAVALLVSFVLDLSPEEFVLFALSIVLLLFAEMMNTAVEEVVDLVEDKYNVIAKNAKDVSAGAVLISSVGVVIMAYVLFSRHIEAPMGVALRKAPGYTGHLAFISFLIVLISVVATKAFSGTGRPLHGGMPSGHAAAAFSLWTSVTLITHSPMAAVMTFVMALLVSHSRLLGGIHTVYQVFLGALMGTGATFLIFYVFSLILSGTGP